MKHLEETTADRRRNFVVVTRVKPDGRKIHYYEWPDRSPELLRQQPDKAASRDADV